MDPSGDSYKDVLDLTQFCDSLDEYMVWNYTNPLLASDDYIYKICVY